jgi:hypothetical protein
VIRFAASTFVAVALSSGFVVRAEAPASFGRSSKLYHVAEQRYLQCIKVETRAKPLLADPIALAKRTLKTCASDAKVMDQYLNEMRIFAVVESPSAGDYADYVIQAAEAIITCRSQGKPERVCAS